MAVAATASRQCVSENVVEHAVGEAHELCHNSAGDSAGRAPKPHSACGSAHADENARLQRTAKIHAIVARTRIRHSFCKSPASVG
jgi:hypothetical protein